MLNKGPVKKVRTSELARGQKECLELYFIRKETTKQSYIKHFIP